MLGLCIAVLTVVVLGAVCFAVPPAEGLGELVRIAFLHIPAAWVSVIAFFMSAWWAASYLRQGDIRDDARSFSSASLGFICTLLAAVSGAVFSKLTWGAYWNWDPRQTTILVLLLIYGAYLTLRSAMEEHARRARVSAVYSLFSFLTVPFLVFIVPRLYFSLHPTPVLNGSGSVDMEPVMLLTLFAAVADATLIYVWLLLKSSHKEEKI
ncbi:cytochrome c biogenesis protein [Schwartzia sp. (in: firmicutes)]